MRWIIISLTSLLVCGHDSALGGDLFDPTRPPRSSAPASPEAGSGPAGWRLSLVRLSDDDRSAVVNGRLVREGDRIGAARVMRIESSHVVLDQGGKAIRISLAGGPIKSPVRDGDRRPHVNGETARP